MAIASKTISARNSTPEMFSHPEILLPEPGGYPGLKRGFDFTVALALFVVGFPIMIVTLLLVKLTSRGPALYSQIRLGKDGKPFAIYKVRTMYQDAERISGAAWATPGDSRITPMGRFLRKTHLDELPQLWNVLRGDMSMVGPRPERPEFIPQLEQAIPYYRARLLVRPGVTGLAQIQLPPDTDFDSVRIKLAYDIHYVKTMTFVADFKICWATAFKMLHISFETIRSSFKFASREQIEREYRDLAGDYQRRRKSLVRAPKTESSESRTLGDALVT